MDIVSSDSYYTAHYVHADYSYNDDDSLPSQILHIDGSSSGLWILYQSHELINPGTGDTPEILSCSITKTVEPTAKNAYSARYVSNTYALKTDIPEPVDLTPYYTSGQADEKFVDEDELAYELDKYETKDVADGKYAKLANLGEYAKLANLSEYAKLANLSEYALKTDIPEIPTDLVNESALSTALYGTELNIAYPANLYEGVYITPRLPNAGVHLVFDVNWGDNQDDDIMHIDVIFKPTGSTSTYDLSLIHISEPTRP